MLYKSVCVKTPLGDGMGRGIRWKMREATAWGCKDGVSKKKRRSGKREEEGESRMHRPHMVSGAVICPDLILVLSKLFVCLTSLRSSLLIYFLTYLLFPE